MSKHNNNNDIDSTRDSLISMIGSLAIVGLVLLFMFGFSRYLKTKTYEGEIVIQDQGEEQGTQEEEDLEFEKGFSPGYIVVKGLPEQGLYADKTPGKRDKSSRALKEGELIRVKARGRHESITYYQLEDGSYVDANGKNVILITDYEKKSGYVAITYISSNGVKLRKWPEFTDDSNIEKYVFVGDKVEIRGRVTTADGISAYLTEDGLYMTTDSQYFKDFTQGSGDAESSSKKKRPLSTEEGSGKSTEAGH